jgi:general secretion pathway protein I
MTSAKGFTLLEVMVALAILATALAAAIRAAGAASQTGADLRQRTLAGWVAENRLAELRARSLWPSPGETGGETVMGGETMRWQQVVTTTVNSRFRRVEMTVTPAGPGAGGASAKLVAYLYQP